MTNHSDTTGRGPVPKYGLSITLGNNVLLVIDESRGGVLNLDTRHK